MSEQAFLARVDSESELPTGEQEQRQAGWEAALRLLDLLEPAVTQSQAFDETLAEWVIGMYFYAGEDVLIVDRGQPLEGAYPMLTLAHEYVHALQDREIDLEALYDTAYSTDSHASISCLVEGEARLYEWLVMAFVFETALEELDLNALIEDDLKYARSAALLSDAPLLNAIFGLPYAVGASYLYDAWRQGGNGAVRGQLAEGPGSTLGWLAGVEAHRAHEGPWAEALTCEAPAPVGLEPLDTDTLGALGWFVFLAHSLNEGPSMPALAAWQQARWWRGDHVQLYQDPSTAAVALSWTVRLDSEEHAAQFAAQAEAVGRAWSVWLRGCEVHLLAAEDSSVVSGWRVALEAACP